MQKIEFTCKWKISKNYFFNLKIIYYSFLIRIKDLNHLNNNWISFISKRFFLKFGYDKDNNLKFLKKLENNNQIKKMFKKKQIEKITKLWKN